MQSQQMLEMRNSDVGDEPKFTCAESSPISCSCMVGGWYCTSGSFVRYSNGWEYVTHLHKCLQVVLWYCTSDSSLRCNNDWECAAHLHKFRQALSWHRVQGRFLGKDSGALVALRLVWRLEIRASISLQVHESRYP